jgi:hypothetical protein
MKVNIAGMERAMIANCVTVISAVKFALTNIMALITRIYIKEQFYY